MRSLSRVLIVVVVPLLLALPAIAEDAKPDPVIPGYSIEFLMPTSEKGPDGWKAGDGSVAGAPTEDGLTELAESCKLDDDTFYVETGVLKQGSDKVGLAMLDVDENVFAFRAKLDAQASASGWVVRELGSPARLAVLSGSKAAAAADGLMVHVVYAIGEMAMNRVRGQSAMQAAGQEAALEYVESIQRIVPDTGLAHGIIGRVHWLRSLPKKRGDKPDRPLQDKSIGSFKKAIASSAKHPPKGRVLVWISGTLGGMLLERKDKALLADATAALQTAVDNELEAPTNNQRYSNRYNLTCALARAGKVDAAFKMLEKSIEVGKTLPPGFWRQSFQHMEQKDQDLAPLRRDGRFKKLMDEHRPEAPKKRPMPPKQEPKKDEPKPKDDR
ncbi:MAG: hypothetical protein QNJ90_03385 [Planctomycetota bacterium]|nr:hypothetical protein [Planctomycetota bacterium]